jgi:hypothetical protein
MNFDTSAIEQIPGPVFDGKPWMQSLGVLMIFSGALQALSLVGSVVARLPIWPGVLLFDAASAAQTPIVSGNLTEARRATDTLRVFFRVQGVQADRPGRVGAAHSLGV